jgi:hypothetical protein
MRMGARRSIVLAPAAVVGAWAALDRDRASRLVSRALVRARSATRAHPPEASRLYARGRHRVEAHLDRRRDGRPFVLAVPVDGSRRSRVYEVDEQRPWRDFERQAGLRRAAWGPCLDLSAGL